MSALAQLLRTAMAQHQRGDLAGAEAVCRQILAMDGEHADALHLLGVIAHQRGDERLAISLTARAIEIEPESAVYHRDLGESLRAAGRLDEAAASYRRAVALDATLADIRANSSAAPQQAGSIEEAIAAGERDLLIIGGGPTGLFAAFYAGLRQMGVKIVDSLDVLGGQLTTLYPEKYIYDVAGFPKVLAKDLVTGLVEQAMQYGPAVCLGEQVLALDYEEMGRIYTVRTNKSSHRARAVLIAAGVGAFTPKTLPLPGVERFIGRGLHYFVKELAPFRGRRVLIVGGGDSAVDWANTLINVAQSVTLIHRRDQFRAHEDSVHKMKASPVKIRLFHELKTIEGNSQIERAIIYDNRSKAEQSLEVDDVLVNIGFDSSLGPLKDFKLEIEAGQIKVDSMMQTSRPGIFAAGDICTYPGKLKLIATGFGEACTAVNYAKHYLDPKSNIFPGHSSNMKR